MKRKKRQGFTLVEMMFVISFLFMVVGYVSDALVQTCRIQNVTGAQYDMQRQNHHELDTMIDDIHDSDLVLSSYTYKTTNYVSDQSSTVVLQAPSYDSSGNPLGTYDIIIYYLFGAKAPYSLYRIVAPAAGSARQAVDSQKIAENVEFLKLTYYSDYKVTGDGVTAQFTLPGLAVNSPTILKNGSTLAGSQYTFTSPQTVTFNTAPGGPDAIDITYAIAPGVSPSSATTLDVDLELQETSTSFGGLAQTQTVELDSRAALRNH